MHCCIVHHSPISITANLTIHQPVRWGGVRCGAESGAVRRGKRGIGMILLLKVGRHDVDLDWRICHGHVQVHNTKFSYPKFTIWGESNIWTQHPVVHLVLVKTSLGGFVRFGILVETLFFFIDRGLWPKAYPADGRNPATSRYLWRISLLRTPRRLLLNHPATVLSSRGRMRCEKSGYFVGDFV